MRGLLLLLVVASVGGVAWTAGFVYGRDRTTQLFRESLKGLSDRINDDSEIVDGVMAVELAAALKHIDETERGLS